MYAGNFLENVHVGRKFSRERSCRQDVFELATVSSDFKCSGFIRFDAFLVVNPFKS